METGSLERVLSRLSKVRAAGTGHTALCPSHDDSESSLSIGLGRDGRVLLKCHAGCPAEHVLAAISLSFQDLFTSRSDPCPSRGARILPSQSITVRDLARHKALPESFLRDLGLEDGPSGVTIPYLLEDSSRAPRLRLRTALSATEGSRWLGPKGQAPGPYGLWKLQEAHEAGGLVLVEGESDSWTCWFHGFPALGIPGASMTKVLGASHLGGVKRLHVVQEPGQGGETFVRGMTCRLRQLGFRGRVFVVRLGSAKDANDLHGRDPQAFKKAFQEALDRAERVDLSCAGEKAAATTPGGVVDIVVTSTLGFLSSDSAPDQIEEALRELGAQLADADPLRRSVAREAAIKRLASLGVRAPAGLVTAALKVPVGQTDTDNLQGRALLFADPDPWPEPIEGPEILAAVAHVFARFLALPEGAADGLALWVLHAHAIAASSISPILAVVSPQKRCGKSTLLDLLGALVPRRLFASSITAAALFRAVEKYRPTLLVDEADTFLARNDELRGVLNAGHTSSTALVVRTVGDEHEPRSFSTFCPKAVAPSYFVPSAASKL
jgi:hypothetical protein